MEATTTTMDATGSPGQPAAESPAAEAAPTTAPVVTALKGAGWFGLGLVALAVEGAGWLVKAATKKGKDVAPAVAKPFKKAESKVEDALGEVGTRLKGAGQKSAEAVERAMDERIAAALARAGTPLMAEMGDLKARVEDLSKKIEALQSKREKAAH